MSHLDIGHGESVILSILSYFPGVPIFFFVSGFLISKSYETNSQLSEYTQNRMLRIFPSLFVCTLLALFSVYLTGYFADKTYSISEFVFWVFGQISFFQFYNPEFMRGFGTGVMNGSLWTISVELQFYMMVPILYLAFGLSKEKNINRKLLRLRPELCG